jgi:hypothetical protein
MKIAVLVLVLLFSSFILLSCKKDNPIPPGEQPQINLTLEDVSCTEAWIKLTTANLSIPAEVELLKDNVLVKTISLISEDTTLYIDSLLPNITYSFKSIIQSNNQSITSSNLQIVTLDTTSHNFTWQTFTFGGQAGSCALWDVSIVNENCILAVGEIYLLDSLGQPDPILYNLLNWDGESWTIERVPYYFEGQTIYNAIKAIFSFDSVNICFGGNGVVCWNGSQYNPIPIPTSIWGPYQINKAWGISNNDFYIVGDGGNIAHYLNGRWSKIESGTSSIINDIWGANSSLNELILYCPVSSFFVPGDKKILKIKGGKVDSVEWDRDTRLYSAWTNDNNFLYVCGEGVYVNKFGKWDQIDLPEVGTNSIRGNNINDIFVIGDYGFKAHFNGIRWLVLSTFNDKGYSKVDIKGDIVAICGNYNGRALIEIGRRN